MQAKALNSLLHVLALRQLSFLETEYVQLLLCHMFGALRLGFLLFDAVERFGGAFSLFGSLLLLKSLDGFSEVLNLLIAGVTSVFVGGCLLGLDGDQRQQQPQGHDGQPAEGREGFGSVPVHDHGQSPSQMRDLPDAAGRGGQRGPGMREEIHGMQ